MELEPDVGTLEGIGGKQWSMDVTKSHSINVETFKNTKILLKIFCCILLSGTLQDAHQVDARILSRSHS